MLFFHAVINPLNKSQERANPKIFYQTSPDLFWI